MGDGCERRRDTRAGSAVWIRPRTGWDAKRGVALRELSVTTRWTKSGEFPPREVECSQA